MARILVLALAVLLIAAGVTAFVIGSIQDPVGGPEQGSAAVYAVLADGAPAGNLTVVRSADGFALSPDGSLREGAYYLAEWVVDDTVVSSEELHLSEDGLWRHARRPVQKSAQVTVDGELHEAILQQAEETRFEGPSGLCGFILPERPGTSWSLPGCTEPFTASEDGSVLMDGPVTVHMASGGPWPDRVEVAGKTSVVFTRILVGSSEAEPPAQASVDLPDRIGWGPRGPPDPGFTVWPLSEALDAAESDALFTDLASFWAQHPDAAVVEADFLTRYVDGEKQHVWDVVVSDGSASSAFRATRSSPMPPEGMEALSTYLDQGATNEFETRDSPAVRYPSPGERPTFLPDPAAVGVAWQTLAGSGGPDAYSFQIACTDSCGATVTVGSAQYPYNRPGLVDTCVNCVWGFVPDVDTLTVDQHGRLVGLDREQATFLEASKVSVDAAAFGSRPARLDVAPAGGVLAVVGLVALIGVLWKATPLAGLFSRLTGQTALENPNRREIFEAVAARPGIHHNALMRATGQGSSSVDHHVRALLRTGHMVERKSGGYTCYYPRGIDARVMAGLEVLKTDLSRDILAQVQAGSGLTGAQLARRTGAEPSTVAYHLRRLESAGLIDRRREGRAILAFPRAVGAQAIQMAA